MLQADCVLQRVQKCKEEEDVDLQIEKLNFSKIYVYECSFLIGPNSKIQNFAIIEKTKTPPENPNRLRLFQTFCLKVTYSSWLIRRKDIKLLSAYFDIRKTRFSTKLPYCCPNARILFPSDIWKQLISDCVSSSSETCQISFSCRFLLKFHNYTVIFRSENQNIVRSRSFSEWKVENYIFDDIWRSNFFG